MKADPRSVLFWLTLAGGGAALLGGALLGAAPTSSSATPGVLLLIAGAGAFFVGAVGYGVRLGSFAAQIDVSLVTRDAETVDDPPPTSRSKPAAGR